MKPNLEQLHFLAGEIANNYSYERQLVKNSWMSRLVVQGLNKCTVARIGTETSNKPVQSQVKLWRKMTMGLEVQKLAGVPYTKMKINK